MARWPAAGRGESRQAPEVPAPPGGPARPRVLPTAAYPGWEAIYADNVGRIYRRMYAKVGNRADAEDLTSQVFLNALPPLRATASVGEVRAYLLATARTVLARHWQDTLGHQVTEIELDDVALDDLSGPAAQAPGEGPERVSRILAGLPDRHRRILTLRFLRGYSIKQSAEELGDLGCQRQGASTPCPPPGGRAGSERRTAAMKRPIDRYVDNLARRRRPKSFAPSEEDLAVARVAIDLAGADVDAQEPREAFVNDLRDRLEALEREPAGPPRRALPGRRGVLAATATGAAATGAGLVGAVTDHVLNRPAEPGVASGAAPDGELRPINGRWHTVAAETDLAEGDVLPFDLGAVVGFVRRAAGRVEAISGICTHQGCRLNLQPPLDRLACPCHGATFTLAGRPLTHPHNARSLAPLPRFEVRVQDGQVQILAPSAGGVHQTQR